MRTYLGLVGMSFLVSALATPLVSRLARRYGVVDQPGGRRMHPRPTPRLGGLAIFAGLLLPQLAILFLGNRVTSRYLEAGSDMLLLLGGAAAFFALGLLDDVRFLSAWHKLPVEVLVASLLYLAGFGVRVLSNPFGAPVPLGMLAAPVSVLWIVGIANAVNFMDGIDGAAAGVAALAVFAVVCATGLEGNVVTWVLATCLIGSALGFLLHNWPPASIFMGDSGALLLGYVLAIVSLVSMQKSTAALALLVPIAALALPIVDTTLAVARRLVQRRPVMAGDNEHIHHRLLELGLPARTALLVIYGISAVCALVAVLLANSGRMTAFLVGAGLLLFLMLVLRHIGAFDFLVRERGREHEDA